MNKYQQRSININKYQNITTKTNKNNHVIQHLVARVWPVALQSAFVLCEYYVKVKKTPFFKKDFPKVRRQEMCWRPDSFIMKIFQNMTKK